VEGLPYASCMRYVRTLGCVTIVGLAVLAGCARTSLTESQCVAGDWETVGYRDGSRGLPQSHLLEHQNACGRHGVVPERERYLEGWQDGVTRFCTPTNGFARGERGADYPHVCPSALEAAFESAYRDGRTLYLARSELARLERLHAARLAELDDVDEALTETALRIATDREASAEERAAWIAESMRLTRSRVHLETEIEAIAADVVAQRLHVDALQHELAFRF
jgi:hypothetical protein